MRTTPHKQIVNATKKNKMLVGITTTYHTQENFERTNREYIDCLACAGFIPALISPCAQQDQAHIAAHVASLMPVFDAFVLTGGEDRGIDIRRDCFEEALVRACFTSNKPLLGICRGMQIMNTALGGTLIDDIASDMPHLSLNHQQTEAYACCTHSVELVPDTHLQTLLPNAFDVNSLHHQALKNVADPYTVCAYAPDGIVEAIEAPDKHFFCGVQWHPEYLSDHAPLFSTLHQAAITSHTTEA